MTKSRSGFSAAVLISGNGSNLQAFIDAVTARELDIELAVVISNKANAYGLSRANKAGVAAMTVPSIDYQNRADFEVALARAVDSYEPDIIVLAGFMRILTPSFVSRYAGRIINIHPSLLPKYPGLHTHQRVLDAGERWHGCTVHYVSEELDGGPAIIQGRVPVLDHEDEDQLAARVLEVEHRIFPRALALIANGRIRLEDAEVWYDGQKLLEPIQLTS